METTGKIDVTVSTREYTDEDRTRALVVYLDNDGDVKKTAVAVNVPETTLDVWEKSYDWKIIRAQVVNRINEEIIENVVERRKRNIRALDFTKARLLAQIRNGLQARNLEHAVETLAKIIELEHKLLADPNTKPDEGKAQANLFVVLGQEVKAQENGDNPFDDTEGSGPN